MCLSTCYERISPAAVVNFGSIAESLGKDEKYGCLGPVPKGADYSVWGTAEVPGSS